MDGQEVIAEEAFLFVTDQVGLQHLLPALRRPDDAAPISVNLGASPVVVARGRDRPRQGPDRLPYIPSPFTAIHGVPSRNSAHAYLQTHVHQSRRVVPFLEESSPHQEDHRRQSDEDHYEKAHEGWTLAGAAGA